MICVCSSQYLGRPDTEEYERGLEEWAHRREEDERRHQDAERELALARERALSPAKAAARAEARSPDADDERRFAVGDEVRFRYGRFGVIAKTNPDGTYDVRYDDGDEERGVESRMIRKLAPNEVERKRAEERGESSESFVPLCVRTFGLDIMCESPRVFLFPWSHLKTENFVSVHPPSSPPRGRRR